MASFTSVDSEVPFAWGAKPRRALSAAGSQRFKVSTGVLEYGPPPWRRVPPVLRLQGLAHDYGATRGVGPITLDLEPGIHGLVGPNGSGKTTLLKTILGFLRPTAGRAEVLGIDVTRDIRAVRARVGYMAENDVFVPGLNAAQTVRLAAELCGLAPARAHEAASEALHAVGLGEEALHSPNRLSTGQRQRMKLASALVHTPQLLFLDEPTNGLDPRGRRQMLDLVREVADERGISVILSTHILPDVQAVCQSAVVLRDGQLVAHDHVGAGKVQPLWFDVEVLGDTQTFLEACQRRRLKVREARAGWQVGCSEAAVLYEVARATDVVLLRAVPSRAGIEDAIMEQLEGGALAARSTSGVSARGTPSRPSSPHRPGASCCGTATSAWRRRGEAGHSSSSSRSSSRRPSAASRTPSRAASASTRRRGAAPSGSTPSRSAPSCSLSGHRSSPTTCASTRPCSTSASPCG